MHLIQLLERATVLVLLAALFGGCTAIHDPSHDLVTGALPSSDQRPQDEPNALGKRHFVNGDYGLAERKFRAAVEANPKSAESWLGLAASYDRLRRFDLAERAYERTIELQGRPVAVLNNLGYHHLLRGNIQKAREYLTQALQKDPNNPLVLANIDLLDTWKSGEPIPDSQVPRR